MKGLPHHSPYVIIGAGIHGLSTAYHLALELKASGKGDGRDILFYRQPEYRGHRLCLWL